MKSTVSYLGAWLGATGLAVAFALASPNDSSVMGHLPALMSHTLTRQAVAVPDGLPSDRTLALITFKRAQREQAESWIQGLNLQNDASIAWVRMPVIKDPGTPTGRSAVEDKLLKHYPTDSERANLMPVLTDRASFVRSAGLDSTEQVYAVVINRQGDVLARIGGQYDPAKARILRETLLASNF